MASCITSKWGDNYSPQVQLTVNQSSSNGGTVTFSWTLQYIAGYKAYTNGNGRSYSVVIDGSTVKSGTYDINQKVGTYTIASGSKTVNKSTSSRNVSFSCSFNFDVTWAGSYSGTRSASGSISISAKESHTVSYNANGGSGAPSSQTKWWGSILTLSRSTPTRTGHTFQGWATSASGSVAYQPGGQYGLDQNVTLYAVWKANTYTVSYNANGGSGAPSSQTKTYGVTLTLSTTKPTRTNYNFKGWGTSAGSTSVAYASGASYTANTSITLYAVWELAYVAPRISNAQAVRATSDGTETDTGTYLKVKFSWSTDRSVSSIQVQRYNGSSWTHVSNITASGTSGTVSSTVAGGYDTETSYQIRILVSDSGGTTYSPILTLPTMQYIIDFKSGGKGVAFGKVADTDNRVDIGWDLKVDGLIQGPLRSFYKGGMWKYGRDGALIKNENNPESGWASLTSSKTVNGSFETGTIGDNYGISYVSDSNYNSGVNDSTVFFFTNNGNLTVPGAITAATAYSSRIENSGSLLSSGNANVIGPYRLTTMWIGFYGSYSDAANSTNRKGWMGFNGGNEFIIRCDTGDDIRIENDTRGIMLDCGDTNSNVSLFAARSVVLRSGSRNIYFECGPNSSVHAFRPLGADSGGIYLGTSGARWSTIYTTTSVNVSSDRTLKKNIETLDERYEKLFMKLIPVRYMWKKEGSDRFHTGFIAQDVRDSMSEVGISELELAAFCKDKKVESVIAENGEEILKEKVITDPNEDPYEYSLRYEEFISLNVLMTQKAHKKINEQQSVIDAQQKEIDDLKSQVQELKELVLAMSKKEE